MKSKTERLENDMESNILEFECVGLNDGGKFPIDRKSTRLNSSH